MSLKVENLHKSFGDNHVLRGLNFEAVPGKAFALLGRNGAGKTTTIRIIMDLFKADQGKIYWKNEAFNRSKVKVAYLPEERGLYEKEPILRQMIYIGELRDMSYREAKHAAESWLAHFDMSKHANDKLEILSKGNQQKIQLAVALMNDPEIIIFDEPFSGLDPVNAGLLKNIILDQIAKQKVVFFSSHQMSYVEDICEDLALLYKGVISVQGSIREIRRSFERNDISIELREGEYFLSAMENKQKLNELIKEGQIKTPIKEISLAKEAAIISLENAEDRAQLFKELADAKLLVDKFSVIEPNLEKIFIHYTGGEGLEMSEAEVRAEEVKDE